MVCDRKWSLTTLADLSSPSELSFRPRPLVLSSLRLGRRQTRVPLTNSRFVAGLGVGALSAIVPLYIGEAAPKKIRGSLLVLYQVQIIS